MDQTNQGTPMQGASGQGQQKNTGMAIVAYILFFVPLLTDAKNDPYVKFHVKQGLVLFILAVASGIIAWTPIFFWVSWIINLAVLVFFIIGVINAATGKEKELPLIGQFAKSFHF